LNAPFAAATASGTATPRPAQNSREYARVSNWYVNRYTPALSASRTPWASVTASVSPVAAQAAIRMPPIAIARPSAPSTAVAR